MKVGGQFLWNVTPICETSQISCLMWIHNTRDVLGNHSKDRLFHLVHWLSITQKLRRISQESINLERKSYLDCSSDLHRTRVEFRRVTYSSQTLKSWRRWTHRKSARKDSMQKRWYFPKKMEVLIFPVADGRIKTSGGDQELRTPTFIRDHSIRGDGQRHFLGESEGSLTTSRLIAGCWWSDKWFLVHVGKLHIPPSRWTTSRTWPAERNHSLFHWSILSYPELLIRIWMSSKRSALMIIGPLMALETCLIHGQVSLFFLFSMKKAPDGHMWSGWRSTRKQLTSRPDHLWPELWKTMGKNAKLKEKQKWSEEKLHLDNARKLRGIYFSDPEDKVFKETIKNARKKLETPIAPAMPFKIMKNCGIGASNKIKTRLACILEADESTRLRMGESI